MSRFLLWFVVPSISPARALEEAPTRHPGGSQETSTASGPDEDQGTADGPHRRPSYREVLIIRQDRPVFFAVLGSFVAEVGPKTLLNGWGSIFCGNQGSLARGANYEAILGEGDRPGGPPGAI